MSAKHKQAIKYGIIAIISSFCLTAAASSVQSDGISAWLGLASIVTGVVGVGMIIISLVTHFDS